MKTHNESEFAGTSKHHEGEFSFGEIFFWGVIVLIIFAAGIGVFGVWYSQNREVEYRFDIGQRVSPLVSEKCGMVVGRSPRWGYQVRMDGARFEKKSTGPFGWNENTELVHYPMVWFAGYELAVCDGHKAQ
jgi:hypothetical protein